MPDLPAPSPGAAETAGYRIAVRFERQGNRVRWLARPERDAGGHWAYVDDRAEAGVWPAREGAAIRYEYAAARAWAREFATTEDVSDEEERRA